MNRVFDCTQKRLYNNLFLYFAGYYERLITGQLDFKWSPEDADAKRPSMATITSDSTPESDSIRTSLADISHGGGKVNT